jgi:hypothetical protein
MATAKPRTFRVLLEWDDGSAAVGYLEAVR